mmetsp:Transcript_47563/g.54938  ORF Transcript_47563/g.54938 Transcript_47563/m.54938 type:complete len:127 (+) Transcript_47563:147-527(+)
MSTCEACSFECMEYHDPNRMTRCTSCDFTMCDNCITRGDFTKCCGDYCRKCAPENSTASCGNCGTLWCRNQCCNAECKGGDDCQLCTDVKKDKSLPWISECKICEQYTCTECDYQEECLNGCGDEN